jgi:hypothetical protein
MGLFKKKEKKTDSSADANPYAAPAAGMDPYAQAQGAPPPYASNSSFRQEKTPAATGPGGRPGGYNSQGGSYGAPSGYGSDRYGGAPAPAQRAG